MDIMRLLKSLVIILAVFFCLFDSQAHPSWGIACAPDGTIYFVDVMHNGDGTLWKIQEDGSLQKMITNIHAHQMVLGENGKLYVAEAIWRQGEIEDEGHNYLYEITPDGKMDTMIFTDDWDLFFGGGFAINSASDVYFSMNKQVFQYGEKGANAVTPHKFKSVNTIFSDSKDRIWITDRAYKNGTIFVYTKGGGLQEVASNLIPEDPIDPPFEKPRHQMFYGISEDTDGNIYVAENGWRKIYRIDSNFETTEYYESRPPWYPVGITFDKSVPVVMEVGYDRRHLGPRVLKQTPSGGWKILAKVGDCESGSRKGNKSDIIALPDPGEMRFMMIGIMLLFAFLSYLFIGKVISK